jgi:signal transduction histidine kinase
MPSTLQHPIYSQTEATLKLAFETKNLSINIRCNIQNEINGKPREQIKNDGVGLGMVFVKTVIDRHFAHISFNSVPGEGTCFTITIPAHNM